MPPPRSSGIASDANLLTRLDRAPLTRTLRVGISVVVLVWLLESFDIGLVSVLILILGPEWGLSSGQIGLLGASGTVGLLLGIIPAGRLSDLYGRKRILIIATVIFGLFTLLCGFAVNFTQLVILRVIAGLGEGALFPLPYLMISELVNKTTRGRIMGYAQWVLNAGYMLPALAGLWAVNAFSPEWSWRVICFIGGIPLLFVPVLAKWVPESPRFQLRRAQRNDSGRERESVRKLVCQIEKEAGVAHDDEIVDPEIFAVLNASDSRTSTQMRKLFEKPYPKRSLIAYSALTASFIIWYVLLTYAPTIFSDLGATKSNSLLYTGIMMFISAFGVFYQGRWADRWGRKPVFAVYIVLSAIGLVLIPMEPMIGTTMMVLGAVVTAWFGLGIFSVPKMYMAEQYPTRLRGLGTSLGEVVSRGLTGGILVSVLPTLLAAFGVQVMFAAFAVSLILLAMPMFLFGQETSGRNMESLGTELETDIPEQAPTEQTGPADA